jgi:cytochrome c oxidase assembly factor CtaG
MSPVFQAALRSWSIPPAATVVILFTALVYLRGWWLLRRAGLPFLPPWRAVAFLAGLLSLWVALASPMDVLNSFVLTAHMLQHMLLMMFVPPLLLLGAPLLPLLRGLPIFAAREFAGPFVKWSVANRVGRALTHPVVALLLMGVTMFAWHLPAAYELALRSSGWHQVEHACFLLASLIFWWPVVQPWPSRMQWQRPAMVPYLLVADLQNTVLSAALVFSDRVLYPSYAAMPRVFGLSALQDQVAAGSMMWVLGSLAFVLPAVAIAVQYLSRRSEPTRSPGRSEPSYLDTVFAAPPNIPIFSSFMRRRFGIRTLQATWFLILFVLAGLLFARLSSTASDDDDQVLHFRQASGLFDVAVFADRELHVGPASFSILVQDRNTRKVLLDTNVEFEAHKSGQPPGSATQATYEDSDNKLLQGGVLDLPASGDWLLKLLLTRNSEAAEFSFPFRVEQKKAKVELPWPYVALGVIAGLLGFSYLRRHRRRSFHSRAECDAAGREAQVD